MGAGRLATVMTGNARLLVTMPGSTSLLDEEGQRGGEGEGGRERGRERAREQERLTTL